MPDIWNWAQKFLAGARDHRRPFLTATRARRTGPATIMQNFNFVTRLVLVIE